MTYANEPLLELRRAPVRERLTAALAGVDATLPRRVPVLAAGGARHGEQIVSRDPGAPDRVVAVAAATTPEEVDEAVVAATVAQARWAARPVQERAAALRAAADEMRRRRTELCALAVRECAKPWAEADADVAEAIDFLEYYAHVAPRLTREPLIDVPGERNVLHRRGRGVVAVIAPWNFPIAIPTGMSAAALAMGNAVCLKPAEQSPACGLALAEALHAGGVPPEVLQLLPGEGDVGAALVAHAGVHVVNFTGSAAVGLEIVRRAAEPAPGQRHVKRVVAEMGGKNCIIADADADPDDVVAGALRSAFGFAGQKCSAASRLLVHERIAGDLGERLEAALGTLLVDQAERFGVDVPPLIEAAAVERIECAVAAAEEAGARVARGSAGPGDGFFAAPAIVSGAGEDAAVVRDELFGPVLAIEPVRDVAHACDVVDALPYALTGGIYSRNPRTIAAVVARSPVGNLYVNRPITGAMVGRQPFGGNRLSGTGGKAGGADYLLQFAEPLVVTESTVRHGVAV